MRTRVGDGTINPVDVRDPEAREHVMRRRHVVAVVAGLVVFTMAIAPAEAKRTTAGSSDSTDYAQTALNILPAGQYGSVPPPAAATDQAQMYDGLTPLEGNVTDADLSKYFKSERFG